MASGFSAQHWCTVWQIWIAAQEGRTQQLHELLPTLRPTLNVLEKALYVAAYNGHVDAVLTLLHAKTCVDGALRECTPLWATCCGYCDTEVVCVLTNAKARTDTLWNGSTAVFKGAENGRASHVQVLVDAKADVNKPTPSGNTPLGVAAMYALVPTCIMHQRATAPHRSTTRPAAATARPSELCSRGRRASTVEYGPAAPHPCTPQPPPATWT